MLVLLLAAGMTPGCAHRHPESRPAAATGTPGNQAGTKAFPAGFLGRLIPRFGGKKQPPPPRATALRRVGTVKSLSNDGSYAIVELEPGVMVREGTELYVTATGGAPARLRAAESQPPYFLADIVAGRVEPGDPVQQ